MQGGCFCGAVRYELGNSSYTTVNCHCSMCRRTSGAPYVTWLVVPEEDFKWIGGPATELHSSDDGLRLFCSDCGSHLACTNQSHPGIVDVTLGTLDDVDLLSPSLEIHTDTKLEWTDHIAELKVYQPDK